MKNPWIEKRDEANCEALTQVITQYHLNYSPEEIKELCDQLKKIGWDYPIDRREE